MYVFTDRDGNIIVRGVYNLSDLLVTYKSIKQNGIVCELGKSTNAYYNILILVSYKKLTMLN